MARVSNINRILSKLSDAPQKRMTIAQLAKALGASVETAEAWVGKGIASQSLTMGRSGFVSRKRAPGGGRKKVNPQAGQEQLALPYVDVSDGPAHAPGHE